MPTPTFKLREPGPILALDDLNALEGETGAALPDDYRHFLLGSNGGFPEPAIGFPWKGEIREIGMFERLLPTPLHGLRRTFWELRDVKVDGFLPIAGSLSQDVCLNLRENYGTLTFTEYIYRDESRVCAHMHMLANSFLEFLESLVLMPVCPIEELGKHGTREDLLKHIEDGNSIDAVGKNGVSILCEAIRFGNRPLIEACIERHANLFKSIHFAVSNRHMDLVKRFVQVSADVNAGDEYGDPPIKWVPGRALPGKEGAENRAMWDLLVSLGAHEPPELS